MLAVANVDIGRSCRSPWLMACGASTLQLDQYGLLFVSRDGNRPLFQQDTKSGKESYQGALATRPRGQRKETEAAHFD